MHPKNLPKARLGQIFLPQSSNRTQVDTAFVYSGGTSEEYLGKIGWKERGLIVHTKLYPWPVRPARPETVPPFASPH